MTSAIKLNPNKKYLAVVPFIMFTLIFSGVIGIIAISLANPNPTHYLRSETTTLQPGEFDTVLIIFDDNKLHNIQIQLKLGITSEGNDIDLLNVKVDIYLTAKKPASSFGQNFTEYHNSGSFSTDIYDSDLSVPTTGSTFFVENANSPMYLIVVNSPSNSIDLKAETSMQISQNNEGSTTIWVLSIIGNALFTLFMVILTVFASLELVEPKGYHAKILTNDLEKKVAKTMNNTEPWETTIAVLSVIFFPIGVGSYLAGQDSPALYLSILGIFIVYYSVKKRLEFHETIISTLMVNKSMSLDNLVKLVKRKETDVKNAIYYLISHQREPIQLNITTRIVTYSVDEREKSQIANQNNPSRVEEFQVELEEEIRGISCAYCGTEAIIPSAKFCADCGASMMPAK